MAQLAFRATCKRTEGHPANPTRCDETFTDRVAFEAHMTGVHRARRRFAGGAAPATNDRKAPGWTDGKPDAPYAWKAPRATAGGLERVARDLAAGKYDLPGLYHSHPSNERVA